MRPPVLLLLLFAAAVACAQTAASTLDGRPVARIEFDPATQPLPAAELETFLPIKPGTPLDPAQVRIAIQKLYDTGRYSNISISGELTSDGAVVVRISTEFNYFVSGVTVEGYTEPPTKGQVLTSAKLELGKPFQESALHQATENIAERLRANGLYHARVSTSVDRSPVTEEVSIRFEVDPGARARFDGVTFTGDSTKSTSSLIHETRWRRGFGPITFPGWRYVTENLIQNGVARVQKSVQKGDHLQRCCDSGQARLSRRDEYRDTHSGDRNRAGAARGRGGRESIARKAAAVDPDLRRAHRGSQFAGGRAPQSGGLFSSARILRCAGGFRRKRDGSGAGDRLPSDTRVAAQADGDRTAREPLFRYSDAAGAAGNHAGAFPSHALWALFATHAGSRCAIDSGTVPRQWISRRCCDFDDR